MTDLRKTDKPLPEFLEDVSWELRHAANFHAVGKRHDTAEVCRRYADRLHAEAVRMGYVNPFALKR